MEMWIDQYFGTFFISWIVTNLPRVQGELRARYPYYFFHGHFGIKTPLILYNADKRNAKNTLIFECAEKNCPCFVRELLKEIPENTP